VPSFGIKSPVLPGVSKVAAISGKAPTAMENNRNYSLV
jgi:hypothetical protein